MNSISLSGKNEATSRSTIFASIQKATAPQSTATNGATESSALFDAINNNGQKPNTGSTNSLKLHTYQLVNANSGNSSTMQKTSSLANSKAPVIQRIQSVNQLNNQSITKTIVSATNMSSSASTATPTNTAENPNSKYKVNIKSKYFN